VHVVHPGGHHAGGRLHHGHGGRLHHGHGGRLDGRHDVHRDSWTFDGRTGIETTDHRVPGHQERRSGHRHAHRPRNPRGFPVGCSQSSNPSVNNQKRCHSTSSSAS